jgi:serine/threonine protein kinase
MSNQGWQIGDVILDQYEVTGKLGEGGMGTVYKVHHRGWNIDLAVKCPRPEIFARVDGKKNFIGEAETWVNLSLHPHIVSCYYVRAVDEIPRIFAEYVTGGSLADWIRHRRLYEGGHLQVLERLLDIAIQFAWGLHTAHEQGLVHQDIKPANVMLTPDGIVKVTDFGLAKARVMSGEQNSADQSSPRSILVSSRGMTPAYCSPEQILGHALSRRTDIWSWGVSLMEMFE